MLDPKMKRVVEDAWVKASAAPSVGAFARDDKGNAVPYTSLKATHWCLIGAIGSLEGSLWNFDMYYAYRLGIDVRLIGHLWDYDREMLAKKLRKKGFEI